MDDSGNAAYKHSSAASLWLKAMNKRPPAVWLSQALFIFLAIWFGFFTALTLSRDLKRGDTISAAKGGALIFCIELLLLLAFWGLVKRKHYGRWLGLLCLILIWGEVCYIQLRPQSPSSTLYTYESPGELIGKVIIQLVINGLILLLLLRFAFAQKVRRFFGEGIGGD